MHLDMILSPGIPMNTAALDQGMLIGHLCHHTMRDPRECPLSLVHLPTRQKYVYMYLQSKRAEEASYRHKWRDCRQNLYWVACVCVSLEPPMPCMISSEKPCTSTAAFMSGYELSPNPCSFKPPEAKESLMSSFMVLCPFAFLSQNIELYVHEA
jgi:hypothetical protein